MKKVRNWSLLGVLALVSAAMLSGVPASAAGNAAVETAKRAEGTKLVHIVNPKCPVMSSVNMETKVEEKMTRMYKGQRVGFCCEVCLGKWDAMSPADREREFRKSMGENPVEITNPKCPVMDTAMEATAPEKMTRMYKGRRIGLCCETCLTQWDAMTDVEREPLVRKAMGENPVEIANSTCPTMGTTMEATAPEKMTRMYKGMRIGFCCETCLERWDTMTDAEKGPLVRKAM
ncbi:MAG: hypothetical protein K9M17_01865 [Mariprofundaceae bacterium]|nr:hypothetical protein [Mariprofundaceae bacterium]